MKFSKININNFRQYYRNVEFELSTEGEKNIVLIGGQNGYGKTNFLISIVWCLYGDKISQIDEHFKKEIQKEKNYAQFMKQSINWTAQKEGLHSFSVSILIEEITFSDIGEFDKVLITRTMNTLNSEETLSITNPLSNQEIFDNDQDKFNFINDCIIPIDAAKFVFFDAEKIAEIANLSIKEEGSFINDALGKILGLENYETLKDDIEVYINTLKKEGANKNLQEQIINRERSIELNNLDIQRLEEESAEKEKEIYELKKEIRKLDSLISQSSSRTNPDFDRDLILSEIENLETAESELSDRISELGEIIPFAILSGKLEEVQSYIFMQEENQLHRKSRTENMERIENFIELLFNKPPEPENSTMSFRDKSFYYEKAKRISNELYVDSNRFQELEFEHDLNNAEKNLIFEAIKLVNMQSANQIQDKIEAYNKILSQKTELTKRLNKIDANLEDDIILEYITKKEDIEHKISDNNRSIGSNNQQITKLKNDIKRFNQELVVFRNKVEINNQNQFKIKEAEKYIEIINLFLEDQKNSHRVRLEKNILKELKRLMHKLSDNENRGRFIEDVTITILASGQGMMVKLLDQDDKEIRKESLSSGEKQIYISCLIKAILSEAIQELPIFIDTPLGRLDEEHRDSLTKMYYPKLSEQVVLFSTNSEITPKRYKDISQYISKSYLLVNDGLNTNLKQGYFNIKID